MAAHSGLDFEKGHSAILELAHQIQAISRMTDLERGITMNVGIVRGGTRTNVVPGRGVRRNRSPRQRTRGRRARWSAACATAARQPEMQAGDRQAASIVRRWNAQSRSRHCSCWRGTIARELGFDLRETAVGGGSDGNFTAGIGIPTLDGLGAVGDGAHAAHEHVIAAELPRRAALLAGLIQAIP